MAGKEAGARKGPRGALILLLGGLFLLLAGGVALLSGNVYRATVAAGDQNFAQRTALSYLVNQVRRGDCGEGVAVGSFGGADALRMTEELETGTFETTVYCKDGKLMELYAEAGSGLTAEDGTAIMDLASLEIRVEGPLLVLTAVNARGERSTVSLSPRCGVREVAQL